MTISLLTGNTWRRITKLARQSSPAKVAVAYFGQGASRLLPLKSGSILVVDLSKAAVRSGQTCPQEVIKLLRRGVEIHFCSNLHAKVFAFGRRAIVGSPNVSRNSQRVLIEAAVETTEPEVVRSCKAFVDSLRGEHVDLDYARRLAKIYRPPRFVGAGKSPTPRHPPFWAVPLVRTEWEAQDRAVFKRGEPVAEKRLKDQERFWLDSYLWTGEGLRRRLRVGELVLQVVKEAPRKTVLYPAARVILIRRYQAEGEKRMMVFLRTPSVRSKNLRDVKERIGEAGKLLRKLKNARLIKSRSMVHDLLQLWPSLKENE
jgi:hypothetical protein